MKQTPKKPGPRPRPARDLRTLVVRATVTPPEAKAIEDAARRSGATVSSWARGVLTAAAREAAESGGFKILTPPTDTSSLMVIEVVGPKGAPFDPKRVARDLERQGKLRPGQSLMYYDGEGVLNELKRGR